MALHRFLPTAASPNLLQMCLWFLVVAPHVLLSTPAGTKPPLSVPLPHKCFSIELHHLPPLPGLGALHRLWPRSELCILPRPSCSCLLLIAQVLAMISHSEKLPSWFSGGAFFHGFLSPPNSKLDKDSNSRCLRHSCTYTLHTVGTL
jgi:hypothetical protein